MKIIESAVTPLLLNQLEARIEAEIGLSFPAPKRRDLTNAMREMAASAGFECAKDCIDWLLADPWDGAKSKMCARHLTVGETYFFREPRAFDLVCDYTREKMAEDDARLRIWSAGCCTGEEPYSIAMALKQGLPQLDPRRIFILGTDLNGINLQIARDGIYRQWSFRAPGKLPQPRWFREEDENRLRLDASITNMVRFAELNLTDPGYPSAATQTQEMDIIFCRNVLMYFSKLQARRVIERFRKCLVDGGWLIVSPSEASADMFSGFSPVYFPDAIYFQKTGASSQSAPEKWALPTASFAAPQLDCAAPVHAEPASASIRPPARKNHPREAAAGAAARARTLASEGKVDAAMHCLDRSINNNPLSVELHHAKALIAMEAGAQRDALQSLKRVIYLQPDFILAHYLLGVLQTARSRPRDAVRHFETAREMLSGLRSDEVVPGSDGLTVASLLDSVGAYIGKGSA
ncbi:CheR family methyltransferase [Noviherbaspirillum sp.]|uniref:CheR family methyltransferase n=1 Tax=Noviherbaspirillum sp. TaxID=1926288 RepID=UPI002B4A4509|nr:CheR family methyltransferase [Noviherbaspirillum sp.]HJV80123.1 CheR family methyltransferase [Noviherbaspirillum sp.]